jgi:hypothetical protein
VAITISNGICQFTDKMDDQGQIIISHARAAVTQAHTGGGDVTLKAE